jgi:hypothetical protein
MRPVVPVGPRRPVRNRRTRFVRALALLLVPIALLFPTPLSRPAPVAAVDCALRYVAGGDHIPAGHEVSEDERFPSQLLNDHLLPSPGPWCVYNTAANETTSMGYIRGSQLATAWNMRPDLITLTIGGEDAQIIKLITECFDKVKDHDFTEANVCAALVLGNPTHWTNLKNNLTFILQQYRMIMAGRPNLVVAVTGYPNPYPKALTATAKIAELCVPLIDTIPTCTARWAQLPPALITLDEAIKKLNSTIKEAVEPFRIGTRERMVYVDVYDKLRDHCMEMKVTIKTKVEHPEQEGAVHQHDSPEVNFGCDDTWFVKGSDGSKVPFYLDPAALGILIDRSQTTKGMGVHPNADGADCISDLIYEFDTAEPGVTPLKWKLRIPEPAETPCD